MIRSALAKRIIFLIKIFRKTYPIIILLIFEGLYQSYISHIIQMPIIHVPVFLLGVTLDKFLKPNSCAIEEVADNTERDQGEDNLREIALRILLPIDEIVNLEGGSGKKAVGYARVSTPRQVSHGESLQVQRQELVELAREEV